MLKRDIKLIQKAIERKYKLSVVRTKQGQLIIFVPKSLGWGGKQDKIEYVEDLMKSIVDDVRQYKKVFDVECDMTYEFIKITFIG